jgi:hypothetical protein
MIALPQCLAAINWTFGRPFHSIKFILSIPQALCDSNKKPSNKGIYFSLYDQCINNIGSYFGIQTNLMRPTSNGHLPTNNFGLLFSRWDTSDENDAGVLPNGYIENANHEGGFVGIRMPIEFSPGRYTIELKSGEIEDSPCLVQCNN